MRWRRENDFDVPVDASARRWGVPVPLIKAVIAAESGFDPRAYRAEPHINDASYGLMQLLGRTARALGWAGDVTDLYDPALSIDLGAELLADNYRIAGDWPVAISAYNAGFSRVRPGDALRTADGVMINAPYVARIESYRDYFGGAAQPSPLGWVTIAAAVGGLVWLGSRRAA